MNAKHTPGNWRLATVSHYCGRRKVITHAVRLCDECLIQVGVGDVAYANARLIAAAPDLLKALELCLNALRLAGRDKSYEATKVRHAISDATGESHEPR